jgi:hypothetical protein
MFGLTQALKPKHWRELYRRFCNHHYEIDDESNLLIAHAKIRGVYHVTAPDGLGTQECPNLWTTEGINYLLSAAIGNGTRYTAFYLAPFSGNVTLVDTLTAATFASTVTELTTQYSQATRVEFVESVPASKATNNTSNPAVFTTAADTISVWGCGLLSTSTKGSTSGVLLTAVKYGTVRSLPTTGDQLSVTYTVSLDNA